MGILLDELGKPRWSGGGLVLLALLVLLLLPPLLRNKGIDHPLSGEPHVTLCPLLPEPPAELNDTTRSGPGIGSGSGSQCEFSFDDHSIGLSVGLTTTREASVGGPQRTSAVYANWLKEVVASGAQDVREQTGPWAMASSYQLGSNTQVLVEDHGVMFFLSSSKLDANALTTYARKVAKVLREPRPL